MIHVQHQYVVDSRSQKNEGKIHCYLADTYATTVAYGEEFTLEVQDTPLGVVTKDFKISTSDEDNDVKVLVTVLSQLSEWLFTIRVDIWGNQINTDDD